MRSVVIVMLLGGVASADPSLGKLPFDKPTAKKKTPIPIDDKEVLNQGAEVRCWEYPHFGVKEVDLGEVGAERLALLPPLGKGDKRACTRALEAGERKLEHADHYYWGAFGDTLLLRSADGANGFSEIIIVDAGGGKLAASVAFQDPLTVQRKGSQIGLRFKTSIDADCEYPKGGKACWDKMRATCNVPSELWPSAPPCPKAKRGKDILPAIVVAPATIADITHPELTFTPGALSCRAKD